MFLCFPFFDVSCYVIYTMPAHKHQQDITFTPYCTKTIEPYPRTEPNNTHPTLHTCKEKQCGPMTTLETSVFVFKH